MSITTSPTRHPSRASAALCVAVSLGLLGCGSSAQQTLPPADSGDARGEPAMRALPAPGAEPEDVSSEMRFALLLAEEALAIESPGLPEERTARALQEWADGELQAWLERKSHSVEAARRALDLAAEEAHRQRIVAGAVVGMLYEDVARVLRSVPVPDDLREEPEIADAFRDVMDFQASPWLEHSRRAYTACAQNAVQPESMHHWSAFCAERADRLPASEQMPMEEGTVVTVTVDY